jgi:hypothetical protein
MNTGVLKMKTPKNQMSREKANELFRYDGMNLFWKKPGGGRQRGKHAGRIGNTGYWRISHLGKSYMAHNIIYNMIHGLIPDGLSVDHVDRDRLNNRIDNLRLATAKEQANNRTPVSFMSNSTSGRIGVGWHKSTGLWRAHYKKAGKQISLGYFKLKDDAIKARIAYEEENLIHA